MQEWLWAAEMTPRDSVTHADAATLGCYKLDFSSSVLSDKVPAMLQGNLPVLQGNTDKERDIALGLANSSLGYMLTHSCKF